MRRSRNVFLVAEVGAGRAARFGHEFVILYDDVVLFCSASGIAFRLVARAEVFIDVSRDDVAVLRLVVLDRAHRFPPLLAHRRDRPVILQSSLEPHLSIVPVEGSLKVTPEQPLVFPKDVAETFVDATEATDMLTTDTANDAAPCLVRVFRRCGSR